MEHLGISNQPFLMVGIPPIKMVIRGMVYYCYTHINLYPPVEVYRTIKNHHMFFSH